MQTGETPMIDFDIQTRCDLAIENIHESTVQPALKNSLSQAVLASAKCTNGFTPERKTQAMSESMFGLVELLTLHCIADAEFKTEIRTIVESSNKPVHSKLQTITGLIKDCKKEIMWICIACAALLAYQPQTAELFKVIFNCRNKPAIVQSNNQ